MTGWVVALAYPQARVLAVFQGIVEGVHGDEDVQDASEKIEGWLDLLLWLVGLDSGGDDGNVYALGTNAVVVRDHGNVGI